MVASWSLRGATGNSSNNEKPPLLLCTPHPHTRLNKLKRVYHILPASLGRDPAGNMEGNNGSGGREYLSACGTEIGRL